MKYFQDPHSQQVAGFNELDPSQLPYMQAKIDAGWIEITHSWPPGPTLQQTQDRISSALTSAINDGAQQWGYNSIESGASYINSTVAQYAADATALISWRDAVWTWAIPRLNVVAPGTSPAEFLAGMPDLPPQPEV